MRKGHERKELTGCPEIEIRDFEFPQIGVVNILGPFEVAAQGYVGWFRKLVLRCDSENLRNVISSIQAKSQE